MAQFTYRAQLKEHTMKKFGCLEYPQQERLRKEFYTKCDVGGESISKGRLADLIREMGNQQYDDVTQQVDQAMRLVDTNGDQHLQFEEWLVFMLGAMRLVGSDSSNDYRNQAAPSYPLDNYSMPGDGSAARPPQDWLLTAAIHPAADGAGPPYSPAGPPPHTPSHYSPAHTREAPSTSSRGVSHVDAGFPGVLCGAYGGAPRDMHHAFHDNNRNNNAFYPAGNMQYPPQAAHAGFGCPDPHYQFHSHGQPYPAPPAQASLNNHPYPYPYQQPQYNGNGQYQQGPQSAGHSQTAAPPASKPTGGLSWLFGLMLTPAISAIMESLWGQLFGS